MHFAKFFGLQVPLINFATKNSYRLFYSILCMNFFHCRWYHKIPIGIQDAADKYSEDRFSLMTYLY